MKHTTKLAAGLSSAPSQELPVYRVRKESILPRPLAYRVINLEALGAGKQRTLVNPGNSTVHIIPELSRALLYNEQKPTRTIEQSTQVTT